MAIERLFIRTPKSIGSVQLDSFIDENHETTVTLTDNPIELGADVTDHAIIQPDQLEIQCVVSDTPLGFAALGSIVDSVTGFFGTTTTPNLTRSSAAYNALVALQKQREPLSVQTKLKLYQNMVITNIGVVQDKDTSQIALMRISFREVIITTSKIIPLPIGNVSEDIQQQASPVNSGRKEPLVPDSETESSFLKATADWIRGS